jgi:sugar phosphate isomerase/epimerase
METMWPVLCSTGAFTRENLLPDHRPILSTGPSLEADGLELLFYKAWYPDVERVADDLLASGLRFPVIHSEKSIASALGSTDTAERAQALKKLEKNCRLGQQLGTQLLILHLWGMPGSDEHLERNLEMLGECINVAVDAELTLAVETIPCAQADPLTNVRRVLEQDERVLIALDTEFLSLHKQLEQALAADWLWQDGCVRHVHIKDYDGQMADAHHYRRYLHPGEGTIDFPGFFRGLAQRAYQGYVSLEASVVQPDGVVDLPKLHASLAHLRELVARKP